jgi:hypothetical protein
MMFSVNPWLWAATGWDYVDGSGIAYLLLAMALLTQCARRASPLILWAAGAAISGMVFTHLFLASLAPLVVLYYFGLIWIDRPASLRRSAATFGLWAGAGFAMVTLALCALNYRLDGNFWFFAPSITRAESMAKDFQFERGIWVNHELAPWLWPSISGCLTAFAEVWYGLRAKPRMLKRPAVLLSVQLLLAAAYMSILQIRGSTVLGHHPYASYLLPFAFLVMGTSFWPALSGMPRRAYIWLCVIAAAAMAGIWGSPLGSDGRTSYSLMWAALSFSAVALSIGFWLRARPLGSFLAVFGFAGFTAFNMVTISQTSYFTGLSLHGDRNQYERIMRVRARIEAARGERFPLFWFNRADRGFHEYFALNATYLAEFSRISDRFPNGCTTGADPRMLVIVLSEDRRAADLARRELDDCWQPFGTHSAIESVEPRQRIVSDGYAAGGCASSDHGGAGGSAHIHSRGPPPNGEPRGRLRALAGRFVHNDAPRFRRICDEGIARIGCAPAGATERACSRKSTGRHCRDRHPGCQQS